MEEIARLFIDGIMIVTNFSRFCLS